MRIVVTGGRGFVGRAVLPLLLEQGHHVMATTSRTAPDDGSGIEWLPVDLLDEDSIKAVMHRARPDALLHLAWYTEHGRFWAAPENFEWALASIRLLHAFRAAGGRRVLMGGTCAEYDWSSGMCIEDQSPLVPHSIYGKAKDLTRHYAQSYCQRPEGADLEFLWGRIFFPYGPGEPEGRLFPSVIRALQHDEAVKCSHGQQMRDFIHVDDVASALVYLLTTQAPHGEAGIYNIASGQAQRLARVIEELASYFPHHQPIEFGAIAVPADDPPVIVGNIEKLSRLGWQPSVQIHEGIHRYVDHFLRSKG